MSFYPNFISILSRCYPNLFKVSFWNLDETVSTLSQFYPNFFWPNSLYSYFIRFFFQNLYPDYAWSFDGIESYFMDLVGKPHQFSGYFFGKNFVKKKVHYAIWTINQFWKKNLYKKWKKHFYFISTGCDLGYHMDCLVPSLGTIPRGRWFCPTCEASGLISDYILQAPRHVG